MYYPILSTSSFIMHAKRRPYIAVSLFAISRFEILCNVVFCGIAL